MNTRIAAAALQLSKRQSPDNDWRSTPAQLVTIHWEPWRWDGARRELVANGHEVRLTGDVVRGGFAWIQFTILGGYIDLQDGDDAPHYSSDSGNGVSPCLRRLGIDTLVAIHGIHSNIVVGPAGRIQLA